MTTRSLQTYVGCVLRYFWASPCSAVGLVLSLFVLLLGGTASVYRGVVEVVLPRFMGGVLGRFGAITFGHVVIGRSAAMLMQTRAHEREHVRQYERWGLAFFIGYPLSSLFELLKGRNPYWFNYFERQARQRCSQSQAPPSARAPGQGRSRQKP